MADDKDITFQKNPEALSLEVVEKLLSYALKGFIYTKK
jgi:hypothetical protein